MKLGAVVTDSHTGGAEAEKTSPFKSNPPPTAERTEKIQPLAILLNCSPKLRVAT